MDKSKGALVIQTETIFECVIEKKFYNIKDSQPYFVQFLQTFNVGVGKIAGGRPQLIPALRLVAVCEICFNDPQYNFEKPDKIEKANEEKLRTTVADIPGLRKN